MKRTPRLNPPLLRRLWKRLKRKRQQFFFESLKKSLLWIILSRAGVTIDKSSKAVNVNLLLETIDVIGLEVIFSSCPESKLKAFVKACGLKTDSQTSNILVRALVDQESIKAEYKPRAGEVPSDTQPEIDRDITVVDLHTHYFRDDLVDWLNNNNLSSTGSKKVLIDRIRRFFDGNLTPKDSSKPRKKKMKEDDEVSEEGGDYPREISNDKKKKRVVEKEDIKETPKEKRKKNQSSSEESPKINRKKKKNLEK